MLENSCLLNILWLVLTNLYWFIYHRYYLVEFVLQGALFQMSSFGGRPTVWEDLLCGSVPIPPQDQCRHVRWQFFPCLFQIRLGSLGDDGDDRHHHRNCRISPSSNCSSHCRNQVGEGRTLYARKYPTTFTSLKTVPMVWNMVHTNKWASIDMALNTGLVIQPN